jgi:hypothetical protein
VIAARALVIIVLAVELMRRPGLDTKGAPP